MNLEQMPLPEPDYMTPAKGVLYSVETLRADRRAAAAMVAEECAKICDALPMYGPDNDTAEWYGFGLLACAAAIRERFGVTKSQSADPVPR